jgi:N-acetyl-anhydromuramyl-L-alanine amidase AmpD
MIDIQNSQEFNTKGIQKKKKQIILCHTSREVNEYLTSLKFRYNNKYDKIPNFIIDRNGDVNQLLPETGHTNFFSEPNINRNSIIVCLENLGWLEKRPLSNEYINWKGNIYNGKVYEKKWRDYFFWQPYTNKQVESTAKLCNYLTDNYKIKRNIIGHNTKVEGIYKYEGIVTRSNFETYYTDLNPSFDFEIFVKFFENE